MRYNTNNPAPSNDPRDLNDNTLILDELMNSLEETAKDRFERDRYTIQAFHNIVIDAKAQIDPTVEAAKEAVNSTADAAIEEMQETAANLGDDLNNKRYPTYAAMLADPQTRDGVVGIVDGDSDPNLDGWYSWSFVASSWVRFTEQPVQASQFAPISLAYETVSHFEEFIDESDDTPGYVEVDSDFRVLEKVDETGRRTFYQEVVHEGQLYADSQTLGGQPIVYLPSEEFELSGYHEVTVDEDGRIISYQQQPDLSAYATKAYVAAEVKANPGERAQLKFAILGDSRTANAFALAGKATQPRSYPFWAEFFSRGAARFVGDWNYGVAGQTTTQILPRAATAAATAADAVVILCGTNDAYGEATVQNIQAMVDTIVATGKYAIVVSELPRGLAGAPPWSTERILQHWKVHQAIMAMSSQDGVRVVNAMQYLLDPSSSIGDFLPGYSYDHLHLNCVAAMHVGKAIYEAVADLCLTPAPIMLTNVDVYSAVDNPTGNLLANGLMQGTGGTVEGAATGSVASFWRASSTSDLSAVASKVAREDGIEWQQLSFSGTASNTNELAQLDIEVDAVSIAAGDVVEFIAEVEVDAGSQEMYGPDMQLLAGGSTIVSVGYNRAESATSPMPSEAYSGVYRSQPYQFANAPASLQLSVRCQGRQGVPTSGTFRISRVSVRKVNS